MFLTKTVKHIDHFLLLKCSKLLFLNKKMQSIEEKNQNYFIFYHRIGSQIGDSIYGVSYTGLPCSSHVLGFCQVFGIADHLS